MTLFTDTTFATAQDLAARCARRTLNTWHVLDDRGHYLIADDADAAAWGDRVVWSVEPEQAFSAAELDGPTCVNCGGAHITWQCPEIRAALFAPAGAMLMSEGDILDTDGMRVAVFDEARQSPRLRWSNAV